LALLHGGLQTKQKLNMSSCVAVAVTFYKIYQTTAWLLTEYDALLSATVNSMFSQVCFRRPC
jgi:hypothetical protein